MPGAADWQYLPDAAVQAADRQQQADDWAQQQTSVLADMWAKAQAAQPPPFAAAEPPQRDDWAQPSPGGPPADNTPSPDLTAGADAPVPPDSGAPALPPEDQAPASPAVSAPFTAPPRAPFSPPPVPAATMQPDLAPTPPVQPSSPTASLASGGDLTPNQFGDPTLSTDEAYAACGPAAAVAFARATGRNPSLREATDLAKVTGWTAAGGMNGVANEQALMKKLGVPTKLEQGADWVKIGQTASADNPITVSTPLHYFVVTGFNPQTGAYHVGASGTAFKAGASDMTAAQMIRLGGQPDATLYMDRSSAPAPDQGTNPAGDAFSALGSAVKSGAEAVAGNLPPLVPPQPAPGGALDKLATGTASPTDKLAAVPELVGNADSGYQTALQNVLPDQVKNAPVIGGLVENTLDPIQQAGGHVAGAVLGPAIKAVAPAIKAGVDAATPAVKGALGIGLDYADQAAKAGATQELASGISPQAVGQSLQGAGTAIHHLLEPVDRAVPAAKGAFVKLANVIGGQSQGAAVTADTLRQQVQNILGDADSTQAVDLIRRYEQTGQFFANPTPEEAALAQKLQAYFKQTGDLGRAGGYITGDVTQQGINYFPHAYDPAATPSAGASPRTMNPSGPYSQGRKYVTIDDAVAAGKVPTSLSDAVGRYAQGVESSEAKVQFVKDLQANAPQTIQAVDAKHPAPDGWISGISIDPRLSSPIRGYAFDPSVGTPLKNLLGVSDIANNPLGSAALATWNAGKQSIFNLSLFHAYTLGLTKAVVNPGQFRQTAYAAINPDFYKGLRYGGLADLFDRAAKAGVTGLLAQASPDAPGASVAAQRLASGAISGVGAAGASIDADISNKQDTGTIWKDAALWDALGTAAGATASPLISRALWERAVPIAKATMFDQAIKSGLPEEQAAAFTNRTLGGLNYDAMGRNKDVQNALRLIVQAPDWNESTIRTLGASIFGKDAAAAKSKDLVLKAALLPLIVEQVVNVASTGHTTLQNDRGHELEIQMPAGNGQNMYVGGLPGNLQAYLGDALKLGTAVGARDATGVADATGKFAANRLAWPIGNAMNIEDGFPLKPGQGAARYASSVAPVSVQAALSAPKHGVSQAGAGAASLLGVNPKYAKAQHSSILDALLRGASGGQGAPPSSIPEPIR